MVVTTRTDDDNKGTLATFEPTSVRCMTRQEECLLKTALALTIVKDRWRHKQDRQESKKASSSSLLECTTVGQPFKEVRDTTQLHPFRLLKQVNSCHLNHLFQVACRLAESCSDGGGGRGGGHTTTSERTIVGVASHLTQQLCAWWETSHAAVIGTSSEKISQEVSSWISSSLVSRPHAGRVHQAMIQHASSRTRAAGTEPVTAALLNLWWSVTTTLLHQVYYHSFPAHTPSLSEEGTPRYCSWTELEGSPYGQEDTSGSTPGTLSHSPQGLERLAISLLQVLETLVLAWQHSSAMSTSGIQLPECFQDVLLPLPSPQQLGQEYWKMLSQQRLIQEPSSHLQPLSVATKLLVRLELYRILLLLPHGPAVQTK